MSNLKKITIPANGPGTHKEMANRVKKLFKEFYRQNKGRGGLQEGGYELEHKVLDIIKEYDIADAMRGFEGRDK